MEWNSKNDEKEWAFANECVKIDECDCMKEEPIATIKEKAFKQIKTLCAKYPNLEWGAGLIGAQNDKGIWIIDEIKLFEQEVRGSYVELTDKGNEEMAKTKTIGWIHSHNTMQAFFSQKDVDNAAQIDGISIVVNNKMEIDAKIRKKMLCNSITLTDLEVETEVEYENEIAKQSDFLIKEKAIGRITSTYDGITYETGELCRWCYENVGKKKAFVDGGVVHKRCKKEFDEWYKTASTDEKATLEEELVDYPAYCEDCEMPNAKCQCYARTSYKDYYCE